MVCPCRTRLSYPLLDLEHTPEPELDEAEDESQHATSTGQRVPDLAIIRADFSRWTADELSSARKDACYSRDRRTPERIVCPEAVVADELRAARLNDDGAKTRALGDVPEAAKRSVGGGDGEAKLDEFGAKDYRDDVKLKKDHQSRPLWIVSAARCSVAVFVRGREGIFACLQRGVAQSAARWRRCRACGSLHRAAVGPVT